MAKEFDRAKIGQMMGLVFWVVSAAWLRETIRLNRFSLVRWKKCIPSSHPSDEA